MYKDKEAQKEANRIAAQKRRDKSKGMTQGITIPEKASYPNTKNVIPCNKNSNTQCPETVILSDGQVWHPDPRYWRPKVEKKESDYPAVVQAVVNKREKMEAITRELKAHNVSDIVRYGIDGPTFDVVGEILDCVK